MTTSKVEINSDTAQPTQQEQVDVLKKEGVNLETMQDANGNRVEVSTPDTQPQGIQNERPEWLPEKFKTAEDLSKAYTELEKQFSQKQSEPETEEAKDLSIPKEEVSENFSIDKYAEEYADKGELSNNSYNELAKQGLSKDLVDGYIAGQKSIADTQTSQIQEVAGGQQQYGELINWASQNLSEAEQQSFNDLTETGSIDQIKLAVQGLMTRAGMTNSPVQQEMLQGDVNNVSVDQFNSVQQVTDAMNDPRYEKDPVFRKEVERKLANSSVF
tara:strand:- start:13227 stop:14042 length:816 start_codon:yes stop_codon:yes gene_type:complete